MGVSCHIIPSQCGSFEMKTLRIRECVLQSKPIHRIVPIAGMYCPPQRVAVYKDNEIYSFCLGKSFKLCLVSDVPVEVIAQGGTHRIACILGVPVELLID